MVIPISQIGTVVCVESSHSCHTAIFCSYFGRLVPDRATAGATLTTLLEYADSLLPLTKNNEKTLEIETHSQSSENVNSTVPVAGVNAFLL